MGQFCNRASLIFGSSFGVIGICLLLFIYLLNSEYNSTFTEAQCHITNGVVFKRECQVHKAGCWNCFTDCWDAFRGLTAIPKTYAYIFSGTFFNEATANEVANRNIGSLFGKCYYRSGGYQIIFHLYNTSASLITSIIFLSLSFIIFIMWLAVFCYEKIVIWNLSNKEAINERSKLKGNIQTTD
jgi:hypothetical protein